VAAQKKNVNFLRKDELGKGLWGKFLRWALTFGRYIVVFTELIVILAFISRFKLDLDLARINEEIERKKTVVASFKDLEKEMRFLQQRLKVIKNVDQMAGRTPFVLNELSQLVPLDVFLSQLEIEENSVFLTGTSLSNSGLATFISKLEDSQKFTKVDFGKVASQGEKEPGLDFEIQLDFIYESKLDEN